MSGVRFYSPICLSYYTVNLTFANRLYAGGYGYEPLPSTSHDALEEENERMADELKDKIHILKSVSLDIGTEIKYQEKLLSGMVRRSSLKLPGRDNSCIKRSFQDEDFERTHGSLISSVSRVLRMARAGHRYYILYLFLFSIAVFIVLWLVLKFK